MNGKPNPTLPPIIMLQWKMPPSNWIVSFHLGAQFSTEPWSCGRKGKALQGPERLWQKDHHFTIHFFGALFHFVKATAMCFSCHAIPVALFFNLVTYLNLLQNKNLKKKPSQVCLWLKINAPKLDAWNTNCLICGFLLGCLSPTDELQSKLLQAFLVKDDRHTNAENDKTLLRVHSYVSYFAGITSH